VVAGLCLLEEYYKNRKKPIKAKYETGSSPIEEELVEAFAILEIQHAFSSGYQSAIDPHHERLNDSQKFTDNIPAEFSTLREAEFMLTMVTLRPVHLRITIGQYENNTPANMTISEIHRDQDRFKQWSGAFAPLLQKLRLCRGSDSYKRATLFQFHYLTSFLWVSSALPLDQWYRKHTAELEECVKLARAILTFGKPTALSLDFQIVHPLMGVGFTYRHKRLRREVADIFFQMEQQEKIRNTVMLAKIIYWIAEIEEEGLGDEDEYVPENVFCNTVKWDFDEKKREVRVACKAEHSGLEESPLVETVICW
jgi:hypothetical protein